MEKVTVSIAEVLLEAASLMRSAGVPDARLDAGLLLAHVLDRDRTFIITHAEESVSEADLVRFRKVVERRASGEPLQYIVGQQEFFGLEFEVTPHVLIPRPETELLVETALELINESALICDVGTGSGCVAISLLYKVTGARAVALDISVQALQVAGRNAKRHSVDDRIEFKVSDCFNELEVEPRFDLIVSNPPYVAENAMAGLQREVRDHEPRFALTPGGDGLSVIKRLIAEGHLFLKTGGHLLIEIGFDQRDAVVELVDEKVWRVIDIYKDLQGIPRTLTLQKL